MNVAQYLEKKRYSLYSRRAADAFTLHEVPAAAADVLLPSRSPV